MNCVLESLDNKRMNCVLARTQVLTHASKHAKLMQKTFLLTRVAASRIHTHKQTYTSTHTKYFFLLESLRPSWLEVPAELLECPIDVIPVSSVNPAKFPDESPEDLCLKSQASLQL